MDQASSEAGAAGAAGIGSLGGDVGTCFLDDQSSPSCAGNNVIGFANGAEASELGALTGTQESTVPLDLTVTTSS